jgi:diacylglycerol kinase (ATP)
MREKALYTTRAMRLAMIYNPAAGRGRARRHIAGAVEHLERRGAHVTVLASNSPRHLTHLAASASRDGAIDLVVVCGGDGTLNLAVREFDLSRGTLGLLPLGSGNDFARVLGIPQGPIAACDTLLDGVPRQVDVALANGLRYLGVAGLGFDSEVAAFANEGVTLLRGSLVYLYAILRVLPRFTPHSVRLCVDGACREEEIMFAVVGNSSQYGGGIRITPRASLDDQKLDLCVVGRTSRLQLLKTLPAAYAGKHLSSPFVTTEQGCEVSFQGDDPLEVYADGERLTTTPVMFRLASEQLTVMAPQRT